MEVSFVPGRLVVDFAHKYEATRCQVWRKQLLSGRLALPESMSYGCGAEDVQFAHHALL
ncbi:hypothetical protein BQ8482_270020 [Mesorhizobium delmotii]|uniref:Uncharacterized protein n=1 Tax=Mesorhizobium delmotii TaxID=1631247 RepID=A0A2P9AMB0_9HYPH|nr:hypothetical protein BQ8482_270020 [Mesorhizobium delmotii]